MEHSEESNKDLTVMQQRALHMLKTYFGYKSFRPAQEAPIASLLRDEDVVGIMPTGAGKSICFQIPALCKVGLTIVFSPLISLMKDQVDGLVEQNIPAALINSTLTQTEFNKTMYDVRSGRIKLLYIAPERLGSNFFCNVLRSLSIAQVIIDETHCISEWGHDFRPSYRLIGSWLETLPKRPVVGAFTATATKAVENDIKTLLGLGNANVYVTGFDRPNLFFSVVRTPKRMDYVVDYVRRHSHENGIIYCSTRKDVERVYDNLTRAGIQTGYYHGGLPDDMRKEMQNKYAFDQLQVMVATNAFGMGIDKSNVRYVLHYQMPRNMESYYQEAGRAGRDGGKAECILLYSGQDVQVHRYLIEQTVEQSGGDPRSGEQRKMMELRKLQAMIDYCFTSTCLRKYMLAYFGESAHWDHCDNCSSCQLCGNVVNVTKEAKAIFRAIIATEERYGSSMISAIVRGEKTDRIVRTGLDTLPVFGYLSNVGEKEIKGLIQQFLASGYLRSSMGKYPVLSITAGAEEVLAGHKEVEEVRQEIVVPSRKSKAAASRDDGRSAQRGGLFEHLRQHRKQLAAEAGIPPYIVFPDTVLIDLANVRPTTLGEFGNIKGVGEAKLKKYGLSFLKAISAYKE